MVPPIPQRLLQRNLAALQTTFVRPYVLYSPASLLLEVRSLPLNELLLEVLALREQFESNVSSIVITQLCPRKRNVKDITKIAF